VLADERDPLSLPDGERHVAHGPALGSRIAESDVLEDEADTDRTRHRAFARNDVRVDLEEEEQIAQVEGLLVHVARLEQKPLKDVAILPKRGREKGHLADRDRSDARLEQYEHIRRVVSERPKEGQRGAHPRAANRERLVLLVESVRDGPVAL